MAILPQIVASGRAVEAHRPWTRVIVTTAVWRSAIAALAAGDVTLVSLWGDGTTVHMALLSEDANSVAVLSLDCPDRRFPSVAEKHAPAIRIERALRDLHGLEPVGLEDTRPWLDHGRWGVGHPLGEQTETAVVDYAFLASQGENLHQIAVGPVHAGIIEPGHFRFTASGETIVRLEERLGYVHKGIAGLMRGATVSEAARVAGRASGDSTVAYAFAFARAVEAAMGVEVTPRGRALRGLMAELERIANHLGDIGAICNDASFALIHAHTSILRERVLRFAGSAFGHRLMMDRIVPGGVAADLSQRGATELFALIGEIRSVFPRLVELYDGTASLQDRTVGTGILKADLARQFGAGGYVGRASSRIFDARRAFPYAPYDGLKFDVPVLPEGDVNARIWIRIREIEQSLTMLAVLANLPEGVLLVDLPKLAGEGMALVEGFRGDVFAWVRLDEGGRVTASHLRDPSQFQWPLLEAVIEGNIVADFPLCNKSFNCSYSGHDL